MKRYLPPVAALTALLLLGRCSTDPTSPPREPGAMVIDFENRPDDGFVPLAPPVTLGSGVTLTDILPTGDLYDFTTADAWGVGCSPEARAFSGDFMIGVFSNDPGVTAVISFASPVSRVELYGGTFAGEVFTLTAYDAMDQVVGTDTTTSTCPTLDMNDLLRIDAASNVITRIEFTGGTGPLIDDLTFYRSE